MYGDKPFGLNDIKLTNIGGTSQVDLPNAQKMNVKLNFKNGKLDGDDSVVALVSRVSHAEFELEAGGISLAAYALLTALTTTTSGTSPSEKTTLKFTAGAQMPYFKVYGKSLGDGADDVHVKLYKCKLTEPIEGELKDGEFYITKCKGLAIDDGTNGVLQIVQEETAGALPTS